MKNLALIILIIGLISVAQADVIKIACLGNSITAYKGTYPSIDENSYPVQLRILMDPGYDIRNFGVHSLTMLKKGDVSVWDEVAFYDALAFEPDIVTVMFGTNDSKPQNWVYRDEFVGDYIDFIDTLRSLPSNPEIYTCFPPPAFSSKYDINDSVIVNDIIPRIQQVADEKNTTVIDFYTHFLDKADLSYDGIHPTVDGLWEYAKVIYDTLTGNTVQSIEEVNLALGKAVYISNGLSGLNHLVDGDISTVWGCTENASVTIDLGAVASVDMFQILLSAPVNFGYTIETSGDSVTWTASAGPSDNPDTTQAAIEGTDPTDARWVRFTFNPGDQPVQIAELRVLETALIHAPVITYAINRVLSQYVKIDVNITSSIKGGYIKYISADSANGIYEGGIGFRLSDKIVRSEVLIQDQEKYFIAKYYNNGYDVASDTFKLDYSTCTGVQGKASSRPGRFALHQNYPNPFNPITTIEFSLPVRSDVHLVLVNMLGQVVKVIADGNYTAGHHRVRLDASDLATGVYFYRLETSGFVDVKKLSLIK
jgi:acyl-CoA thioesterase-1